MIGLDLTRTLALIAVTANLVAQSQPPLPKDELPATLFSQTMPLGLPATMPAPADNPFAEAPFRLGRRLFFDPILSANRTVSCASCHEPEHGFSSRAALPAGVFGRHALRHAPTLFNRGFGSRHRWDGKTPTLEQQVLLPIEDPNEMDLKLTDAVMRLGDDEGYRAAFQKTFGEAPTEATLSRSLSTFVRGLVSGDTPVDRFQAGNSSALNSDEKAGLWIYESKGRCWSLPLAAPNFSDERAPQHRASEWWTASPADGPLRRHGKRTRSRAASRRPPSGAWPQSAPYMHDGSLATLEDVVDFYARGRPTQPLDSTVESNASRSHESRTVRHLIAFLHALWRGAPIRTDARP